MSLWEMPEHFVCDTCHEQHPVDALCTATMRRDWLTCQRCCPCATHQQDDPGGTVVWPWHGLDGSAGRMRRQT